MSTVDFLIRHQSAVMAGLILLIAAFVFGKRGISLTILWLHQRYGLFSNYVRVEGLFDSKVLAPYTLHLLSFPLATAATLALLAGGVAWFHLKPIPSTVGLEAPLALTVLQGKNRGLILFIHGWNGDPTKSWEKFPELVMSDPRFSEFQVQSISYPTYMARRNASITEIAAWLEGEVANLVGNSDSMEIVIVAHSMGGLIARHLTLLRLLRNRPGIGKIVIEIGTPHDGANPAALASALGISKDLTSDMQQDSSFLKGLKELWQAARNTRPTTVCFSSPHDKVVSQSSAHSQCDEFQLYLQWGHSELIKPQDHNDPRYVRPSNEIAVRI